MMNSATLALSNLGFNRQSVQVALKAALSKLNLYRRTPDNGLVLFCGYNCTDGDKKKMINIDFEPLSPLQNSLYYCGSSFQTEPLREQLQDHCPYGFIIMDGAGFYFYVINGSTKEKLYSWEKNNLPNKHSKGGQSSNRFARLRTEKRHAYVCKVAEAAVLHYIDSKTNCPSVVNLIIAGSASLKKDMGKILDPRLSKIVAGYVDIQYGGNQGLQEAISKSKDLLQNLEYTKEQNVIRNFFEQISIGSDLFAFGTRDTMYALEAGALEKIIVWTELPDTRFVCLNKDSGNEEVLYLKHEEPNADHYEILHEEPLFDWIIDNHMNYGSELEIVTDSSPEGVQFCKGFSGIGGTLRFLLDLPSQMDTFDEDSFDYEW